MQDIFSYLRNKCNRWCHDVKIEVLIMAQKMTGDQCTLVWFNNLLRHIAWGVRVCICGVCMGMCSCVLSVCTSCVHLWCVCADGWLHVCVYIYIYMSVVWCVTWYDVMHRSVRVCVYECVYVCGWVLVCVCILSRTVVADNRGVIHRVSRHCFSHSTVRHIQWLLQLKSHINFFCVTSRRKKIQKKVVGTMHGEERQSLCSLTEFVWSKIPRSLSICAGNELTTRVLIYFILCYFSKWMSVEFTPIFPRPKEKLIFIGRQ